MVTKQGITNGGSVEKAKEEMAMEPSYEMLEQAKYQGRKEGFKEGVTSGIMEGIEEGQYREKMNTAYRMILAGESDENILAYTEVTRQEAEEYME